VALQERQELCLVAESNAFTRLHALRFSPPSVLPVLGHAQPDDK
jgi:hypothetical protein